MADGFAGAKFDTPFDPTSFRQIDHQSTMGTYVGRIALRRTARARWWIGATSTAPASCRRTREVGRMRPAAGRPARVTSPRRASRPAPPPLPLTGFASASSLFLVAAGLTVIFGVTRVVNFAHGSLFMLGAYLGWSVLTRLPREPPGSRRHRCAPHSVVALGTLLEIGLLRRVYRAPELFQLLATFGVVLIVQDATLANWGPQDLSLPGRRGCAAPRCSAGPLSAYELVLIVVGPVLLL